MIMHLDYEFEKDGQIYSGRGIDIGETIDIENERKNMEQNKISAICHEFDLTIDEFEEQNINVNDYKFNYCELY